MLDTRIFYCVNFLTVGLFIFGGIFGVFGISVLFAVYVCIPDCFVIKGPQRTELEYVYNWLCIDLSCMYVYRYLDRQIKEKISFY